MSQDKYWINARLATLNAESREPYGQLFNHALHTRNGQIVDIIPMNEVPSNAECIDVGNRWITPGLIDCHTHLVYGGSRAAEWEMRLQGVPYQTIAAQGGGILSTVKATRALSEDELYELSLPRLKALMQEGVSCIEIKTGYGLNLVDEIKTLNVIQRLAKTEAIEISATLLSAHALPPEFAGRADDYIQYIIDIILPEVADKKLAQAVDVFCEGIGFSVEQSERLFQAAQAHGLAIKGHVEQLSNLQGASLLAKMGAWSADHIEYLDANGIEAMAKENVVGVLLPGAFYFLKETQKPPVQALKDAGVALAVASDLNPGTSPFVSLRLAMNQACVLFGLTPEEALLGVTRHAAQALGRKDTHGELKAHAQADFLIWNIDHPAEIAYSVGSLQLHQRVFKGQVV